MRNLNCYSNIIKISMADKVILLLESKYTGTTVMWLIPSRYHQTKGTGH